ncbi:MAG: aminotransferase class III-fold pyridoxal phosphate-dependent enzyme, partial [Acidimicrobiales bacterium]
KATLDYVLEHDLQQQALRVGTLLREGLEKATAQLQMVGDVRGKGLMIGVELVRPGTTEPDTAAAAAVMERAREGGLLIGKGGLYGNCLRIAPPLSLTAEEAVEGAAIITSTLDAVQAGAS